MHTTPINPPKGSYKVRNWKAYNSGLCKRGSLTLFIDSSVLDEWEQLLGKKKEVGTQTYPASIIQCCLLDIGSRLKQGENLVIGIDSTGLKVCREGEWKVRKHGWSKRRTWRKMHICIDLNTQQILSVELTGNEEDDASAGSRMLKGNTNGIGSFYGDGAYDKFDFRQILGHGIDQIIPPPKNAVIQKAKKGSPLPDYLIQRNRAVVYIDQYGLEQWKREHGYHKRSLNEVVMYRFKAIFGGELDARKIENQITEVRLKSLLLNKFTGTGMPDSYKIA